MAISGVGSFDYANCYQTTGGGSSRTGRSFGDASTGITLHMTDGGETGAEALSCFGSPNGTSASVYKAENYTEEDPRYLVKFWDENGDVHEYRVNPREVDPSNASCPEMLAYAVYSDVQGYTTDAYRDFMSAAGGVNADQSYDSGNIDEKKNFKLMLQEFMQMQYDAGNISGYLSYKQFYDHMNSTGSTEDYSMLLAQYAEQIKEKLQNGDTEPSFQTGGQSFTEKEWEELIAKIDRDIDQTREDQTQRTEKEKEKELLQELLKDGSMRMTGLEPAADVKDNLV